MVQIEAYPATAAGLLGWSAISAPVILLAGFRDFVMRRFAWQSFLHSKKETQTLGQCSVGTWNGWITQPLDSCVWSKPLNETNA